MGESYPSTEMQSVFCTAPGVSIMSYKRVIISIGSEYVKLYIKVQMNDIH